MAKPCNPAGRPKGWPLGKPMRLNVKCRKSGLQATKSQLPNGAHLGRSHEYTMELIAGRGMFFL